MANIEKDILVLKRKLDEINSELTASYKRLGKKLLFTTSDSSTSDSFSINDELVSSYNKMLEERTLLTGNILEIKSSYERLSELTKFKKQVLKSLKETDSSISKLKIKFALSFYESFKNLDCFLLMDDEIEKAEKEIEELSTSTEALDEEKKEAGFLSKFNINRKIARNKFKTSLLKKNIERKLCKHSNEIFEMDEVSSLLHEGKMTEELIAVHKEILEDEETKKDLDNRILGIQEEESFLLDKMQELCENTQYLKQITNLNLQIKKIDEAVDETLKNIAIEFVSPFLDELAENAEKKLAFTDDIKEIKDLKNEVKTINYNIEYCNLSSKKDSISNKITYMNKAIENCESEIKNYEEKIENLKKDIEASNKEKKEIDEDLIKLESLIKDEK